MIVGHADTEGGGGFEPNLERVDGRVSDLVGGGDMGAAAVQGLRVSGAVGPLSPSMILGSHPRVYGHWRHRGASRPVDGRRARWWEGSADRHRSARELA
jgi:hypothetical protein